MRELPVVDISALRSPKATPDEIAHVGTLLDRACRDLGFFLVVGHGVPPVDQERLDEAARAFFAQPEAAKAAIAMDRGGRAWRGWFPEGGELTSGRPDRKEGLYFGRELAADHPAVRLGTPLHGPNLFPDEPADLRPAVLGWMDQMTELGHALAGGLAVGLGLERDWFDRHLTAEPTVLFRIFRYPPIDADDESWGVAEHTDYGLLTILAHDVTPGLEVHLADGWLEVPAVAGSFVVNLGDMLERMTGGVYRSTPHRVRHRRVGDGPGRDRLSFPFFFDPGWDAQVRPVPGVAPKPASGERPRWDGTSVHEWSGTYGDYLVTKVTRVFPGLGDAVLGEGTGAPERA